MLKKKLSGVGALFFVAVLVPCTSCGTSVPPFSPLPVEGPSLSPPDQTPGAPVDPASSSSGATVADPRPGGETTPGPVNPSPPPGGGLPPGGAQPPIGDCFRFVAWGDTKSATSALAALSLGVKALQPRFNLYCGDLVPNGFTTSTGTTWKNAVNGGSGNGMFDITFPIRGNHDSGNKSVWQSFFDLGAVAAKIGATHYLAKDENLTYSFDVGNSHFIGIDVPGDVTGLSLAQLTWMDQDLSAAEARGLTHAFLFWHGPIYPVAEHCCPSNPAVIDVFNKHPIVSATFHGHEHTYAWVHINKSRYPNATREFEMFVSGDAGAGPVACDSKRADYCQGDAHGFMAVDVAGKSFTVSFYVQGNPQPVKQMKFTKP